MGHECLIGMAGLEGVFVDAGSGQVCFGSVACPGGDFLVVEPFGAGKVAVV